MYITTKLVTLRLWYSSKGTWGELHLSIFKSDFLKITHTQNSDNIFSDRDANAKFEKTYKIIIHHLISIREVLMRRNPELKKKKILKRYKSIRIFRNEKKCLARL